MLMNGAVRSCFMAAKWLKCNRISVNFGTVSYLASPRHFGHNFRSRSLLNKERVLEQQNAHATDQLISFDEKAHKYAIDGKPAAFSVTQLVAKFFSSFDAEVIIQKMINGRKWPREGYINKDGTPFTAEQIKKKWDDTSVVARNRGTWMHYNIERYFNNLPYCTDLPEFQQFGSFVTEVLQAESVTPFRTEWRICGVEENLCGTIDFIGQLPDMTFMLLDWKRLQNVNDSLCHTYGERASAPFDEYDDCDGVKYMVQLNTYKYLLEKYYGIKVSKVKMVSFHPNQTSYLAVDVPAMDTEVQVMLNNIRSLEA